MSNIESSMSSVVGQDRVASRGVNIAAWVLAALLAVAFLGAGGSKLAGVPLMVQEFEKIGVGQWFRFVTGGLEVIGAVSLLIPRVRFYGAGLLCTVMIGAILSHLTILGGNPTPSIVLLLLAGTVAYLRRS